DNAGGANQPEQHQAQRPGGRNQPPINQTQKAPDPIREEVEEDDQAIIDRLKEHRAGNRIGRMKNPADQQMAELVKNLKTSSPEDRLAVAEELGKRGRAASAATKALCEATLDSSESV